MADPIITTTPITPVTAYSYIAEGELALQNWNDLVFQLQNNLNYLEDLAGIERTALVAMQRDGVRRLFAWQTTGAAEWIDAIDAVRAALGFDEFMWPVGFAMSLIGGDRWMSAGDLRIMARAIGLPAVQEIGREYTRAVIGTENTIDEYKEKKKNFVTRVDSVGNTVIVSYDLTRDAFERSRVVPGSTSTGDIIGNRSYYDKTIKSISITEIGHITHPSEDQSPQNLTYWSTLVSKAIEAVGPEVFSRYNKNTGYGARKKYSASLGINATDPNIYSSIYEPQILYKGNNSLSSGHEFTLTTNFISVHEDGGNFGRMEHVLEANEATSIPISIIRFTGDLLNSEAIGTSGDIDGSTISIVADYDHDSGYSYIGIEIDDMLSEHGYSLGHKKPAPMQSERVWVYPDGNQYHDNGIRHVNYMAASYAELTSNVFWFAARK